MSVTMMLHAPAQACHNIQGSPMHASRQTRMHARPFARMPTACGAHHVDSQQRVAGAALLNHICEPPKPESIASIAAHITVGHATVAQRGQQLRRGIRPCLGVEQLQRCKGKAPTTHGK